MYGGKTNSLSTTTRTNVFPPGASARANRAPPAPSHTDPAATRKAREPAPDTQTNSETSQGNVTPPGFPTTQTEPPAGATNPQEATRPHSQPRPAQAPRPQGPGRRQRPIPLRPHGNSAQISLGVLTRRPLNFFGHFYGGLRHTKYRYLRHKMGLR